MFETETVECGKFKIDVIKDDIYIGNAVRRGYEWDNWMRQDVEHFYKPNTSIIDVGGNIGCNTLMFSDYGPVHVYEPVFGDIIQKNVNQNNLKHEVHVNKFGLSDREETVKIYRPKKQEYGLTNYGGYSMNPNKFHDIESYIKVNTKVYDLDVPISFVKIDVEGHEEKVLRGMETTLRKWKPYVMIEDHDFSSGKLTSILKDFGYTRYISRPEAMYGYF